MQNLESIDVKSYLLERLDTQLNEDALLEKSYYEELINEKISSVLNDFIRNIERKIRRYEESQKVEHEYKFHNWLRESSSNVICFLVVIFIPTILFTIVAVWSMIPRLELYTFWDENLWVVPLLISLIPIEIILILVINAVIKERKSSVK